MTPAPSVRPGRDSSGKHRWKTTGRATGQLSVRAVEDEWSTGRLVQLHEANYCAYGYRRMWKALRREGIDVGRDRVKRLMRTTGIQGAKRRGKPWRTTASDPRAQRPGDLVERDFTATPARRGVGR
jgi:putative transposase